MKDGIGIKTCRGLDKKTLLKVIQKISLVSKHHLAIDLHIFNTPSSCLALLEKIEKKDRDQFIHACNSSIPFSYHTKNKNFIVLFSKNGSAIITNKKALMGLLFHEIEHLHQIVRGTTKGIQKEHALQMKKLERFKGEKKEIAKRVVENATLLLKDLYTNTQLVKEGFSDYLIEYYQTRFNAQKSCPAPQFYRNFKKEADKNPWIVETVLKFEFALLSVSLPVMSLDKKKANILKKDISKCYEINIQEIVKRCHLITETYKSHFTRKDFNKRYFSKVFEILSRVFK